MTDNDRGPQGMDVVTPGAPRDTPPHWDDQADPDQHDASTFRPDQTMYPPQNDLVASTQRYEFNPNLRGEQPLIRVDDPGVTDPADADGVTVRTGPSPETVQAQQEQGQDRTPNAKPLHSDQGNEGAPS